MDWLVLGNPVRDWSEQKEAREAFFADTPDLHSWSIEDQELFHQFARAAERAELLVTDCAVGHIEAFGARVVVRR